MALTKNRTRPQPKPRGTATDAKRTQVPGAHDRGAVKAVAAARHAPGGRRDMADTSNGIPGAGPGDEPAYPEVAPVVAPAAFSGPGATISSQHGYAVIPDLGADRDPFAAIPGAPGEDSK
jgi:hypothetical protein